MPTAALMTTAAVSTASSAGRLWPRKSGPPGVSMKWTRVSAWLQVHHGGVQRMLHAALERVVVADGAAALQRARRGDGAGAGQQGLGQAGLAGGGGADEGQRADRRDARGAALGWAGHEGSPGRGGGGCCAAMSLKGAASVAGRPGWHKSGRPGHRALLSNVKGSLEIRGRAREAAPKSRAAAMPARRLTRAAAPRSGRAAPRGAPGSSRRRRRWRPRSRRTAG